MAIDIRATVACSLGGTAVTLISGSISDDYVQGQGLIKTKGSIEVSGTYTPAIGTVVTFSYTKGGVTRAIPRKLRVLSSFADPFRRTTSIELGCKLTYLSDLQEPIDWTAFDDPGNAGFTQSDAEIITLPIRASSVMDKCLSELGITASSSPLTNKFSIPSFDFGAGYVSVLSDLLVSESYCGYLDTSEVLQIINLDQPGGTGPVIEATKIIDLGPVGVGQLPGEAVVVSYSTLKLRQPDANAGQAGTTAVNRWELDETTVTLKPLPITYADGQTRTFTGSETTTTATTYSRIVVAGERRSVVTRRVKTVTKPSPYAEEARVTALLKAGVSYASVAMVASQEEELTSYSTTTGEPVRRETLIYEDRRAAYSRTAIPLVYSATDYVAAQGLFLVGRTVQFYSKKGEFTKTVTHNYAWQLKQQSGSQASAEKSDLFANATAAAAYLATTEALLVHVDSTVDTRRLGVSEVEGRPDDSDLTNSSYADGGDPNNGWRTESSAELELALGSAIAQRRIELSLPYAPDDTFTRSGSPGSYTYSATASDAPQKAAKFGRVQNRLLLGNRSGMSLQVAPETLPAAPYAPIVVQANGLSALYRTNGTSWQLSADGVLVATDALFWGAVGGTGTFWFPVAPGVTTLPTTPPVVDGQMTVTSAVPVWNETVVTAGTLMLGITAQSLPYSLTLLAEVPAMGIKIGGVGTRVLLVEVPAAAVTVAAVAPRVAIGAAAKPPAAAITVAGLAPTISAFGVVPAAAITLAGVAPAVSTGASVAAPAVAIAVAGVAPDAVGPPPLIVNVPAADVVVAGVAPTVSTGASVAVPAAAVTVAGVAPSSAGAYDPSFSSVSLLLHMDGSNNSTTFTDNSSNALTVAANGNAKVSTAQSKFGGASGYFDGSGDYLQISDTSVLELGSGDYTIEFWIKTASTVQYATIYSRMNGAFTNGSATLLINNASATAGDVAFWVQNYSISGPLLATTGVSVTDDAWHHIAVVRNGSSHVLYVDGTSRATATATYTIADISTAWSIGSDLYYTARALLGYIDDLRITKGVARTIVVPTAAFPDR